MLKTGFGSPTGLLMYEGHALPERLRGTLDPVHLFQTVPGIGPKMAEQIHEALHIDTLEALETAAWDGRLETVRGVGARRIAGIRNSLLPCQTPKVGCEDSG